MRTDEPVGEMAVTQDAFGDMTQESGSSTYSFSQVLFGMHPALSGRPLVYSTAVR